MKYYDEWIYKTEDELMSAFPTHRMEFDGIVFDEKDCNGTLPDPENTSASALIDTNVEDISSFSQGLPYTNGGDGEKTFTTTTSLLLPSSSSLRETSNEVVIGEDTHDPKNRDCNEALSQEEIVTSHPDINKEHTSQPVHPNFISRYETPPPLINFQNNPMLVSPKKSPNGGAFAENTQDTSGITQGLPNYGENDDELMSEFASLFMEDEKDCNGTLPDPENTSASPLIDTNAEDISSFSQGLLCTDSGDGEKTPTTTTSLLLPSSSSSLRETSNEVVIGEDTRDPKNRDCNEALSQEEIVTSHPDIFAVTKASNNTPLSQHSNKNSAIRNPDDIRDDTDIIFGKRKEKRTTATAQFWESIINERPQYQGPHSDKEKIVENLLLGMNGYCFLVCEKGELLVLLNEHETQKRIHKVLKVQSRRIQIDRTKKGKTVLRPFDVLCGRGGRSSVKYHKGTGFYWSLILENRTEYLALKEDQVEQKRQITERIIDAIHEQGGQFVIKDKKVYFDLKPESVPQKVMQALRDGHEPKWTKIEK